MNIHLSLNKVFVKTVIGMTELALIIIIIIVTLYNNMAICIFCNYICILQLIIRIRKSTHHILLAFNLLTGTQ